MLLGVYFYDKITYVSIARNTRGDIYLEVVFPEKLPEGTMLHKPSVEVSFLSLHFDIELNSRPNCEIQIRLEEEVSPWVISGRIPRSASVVDVYPDMDRSLQDAYWYEKQADSTHLWLEWSPNSTDVKGFAEFHIVWDAFALKSYTHRKLPLSLWTDNLQIEDLMVRVDCAKDCTVDLSSTHPSASNVSLWSTVWSFENVHPSREVLDTTTIFIDIFSAQRENEKERLTLLTGFFVGIGASILTSATISIVEPILNRRRISHHT